MSGTETIELLTVYWIIVGATEYATAAISEAASW